MPTSPIYGSPKTSSGESSIGIGSSSSGYCEWSITGITYVNDDEMQFTINNSGSESVTFTSIDIAVDPGATITPAPPFTLTPGATQLVTVTTAAIDLRATLFTVVSDCGSQSDYFPVGP